MPSIKNNVKPISFSYVKIVMLHIKRKKKKTLLEFELLKQRWKHESAS